MVTRFPRAVLVTGFSSAMGQAIAGFLAGASWPVYAGGRRPERLATLERLGCTSLALDVTDAESMRRTVATIEEAHGAVGVLVNDAGFSRSAAMEVVRTADVRRQFETDFVQPERRRA